MCPPRRRPPALAPFAAFLAAVLSMTGCAAEAASDGTSGAPSRSVADASGPGEEGARSDDAGANAATDGARSGADDASSIGPFDGASRDDGAAPRSTAGRVIGYLPGWMPPPPAAGLAAAGYTNVIVAFAVFSTSSPGELVSSFGTVTSGYVAQLHAAGIRVSLSIGGASTSIAGTSVDFDQVLSAAPSPAAFEQAFVASVQRFVAQYGFDGIDIDIEQGLKPAGTFAQPTGDIAVLAAILQQLHAADPSLLLSLVPQSPNVSATSGFNDAFGNYSSLIEQTYAALSWVGIQLYNSGCDLGIDGVCYDPNDVTSPSFSVAMATDLLADWPGTNDAGQATGFQPYVSHLDPRQVVLGYPAPDGSGVSDGSPVTPAATIKRAIACLETGIASPTSCGSFVPPKVYPNMGGVFDWEVVHDQGASFAFATQLAPCAKNGDCQ